MTKSISIMWLDSVSYTEHILISVAAGIIGVCLGVLIVDTYLKCKSYLLSVLRANNIEQFRNIPTIDTAIEIAPINYL